MDNKVKFAIYTSFYNCFEYVDRIFENVLSIDYPDWKWFITDDFSTDGTGQLIQQRIKGNDRIQYVEQTRKKEMYWQPNKFISADYEYILLVCSDDKVDKNILKVYDNEIRKNKREVSVLTCDLQEIYENSGNIKSIGYVLNSENILEKLDSYYPSIDYVNNFGYFAFGLGMCFKNFEGLNFEINDFLASSEDFYRILYMNSLGKWVHIPRNLYTWVARSGSESRKDVDLNFYKNFEIAFNKCKDSVYEPIYYYNDCYKELNSLMIKSSLEDYKNISIISPWLSKFQKIKIRDVFPDKNIEFNLHSGCDLYSIIANYNMDGDSLIQILNQIKDSNEKANIVIYCLDETVHYSNDDVSNANIKIYEILKNKIEHVFQNYYFFLYFRHINFVIQT